MDPVTIVSLVATCATLATKAVTAANSLDEFVKSYRAVDRSVYSLATTLRLFSESLSQLQGWLEGNYVLSRSLKRTIQSSVQDFRIILDDLEEHVSSVQPRNGQDTGFRERIKHLWNSKNVEKQEAKLHSQFQTVMMLITFIRMNDTSKQSHAILAGESQSVLAKSAFDAQTIRIQRDNHSIRSAAQTSDDHLNTEMHTSWDAELDVDDEIVRSGPYLAHFRSLMKVGSYSSNSQETTSNSPQANDGEYLPETQTDDPELEPTPLERRSKARTSILSDLFGDRNLGGPILFWGFVLGFTFYPFTSFDLRQRALLGLILSASLLVGCALLLPKSYLWDNSAKSRQLVEQLCQATRDGDHAWISDLLGRGAYVNGFISYEDYDAGPMRHTALLLAVNSRRLKTTQFLLQRGADVHSKTSGTGTKTTPLLASIREGSIEIMSLLLKHGADPSSTGGGPITPLSFAARKKRLDMVKLLVRHGAETDGISRSSKGIPRGISALRADVGVVTYEVENYIALHIAVQGRPDMVDFLYARTGKVSQTCKLGSETDVTPLHLAREACAELSISYGADIRAEARPPSGSYSWTPLFWAVSRTPPDVVALKANLASGMSANAIDHHYNTALHVFVDSLTLKNLHTQSTTQVYCNVVKALLDAGANVSAKNWSGVTPLTILTQKTDISVWSEDSKCGETLRTLLKMLRG